MANTDQKLVVSELDFFSIKNNLKNFLRDQEEFTDYDFEAAGLNVLLDILAYNTHYMAFYNNMIANEMFLDTAILRDSVVSHAKMLGYTPVSSVAPRAQINLQITRPIGNTQTTLTLPKFTKFQSSGIVGTTYQFVTLNSVEAPYDPACNRFCFDDLFLYQGTPLSYTFTYNATNNATQSFELPDNGIDTSTIEVIVQESATSLRSERFTLATDATTVTSTSPIFFLDESRNGKYKIYFGDDVIGKKLTNGNVIIVTYIRTEGAAANKANSFNLMDVVGGFSQSIIFPIKAAQGGASQESIERIRSTATKAYVANGRGVTKDDLIALINKNYPYFEAVNVWGGEENDPPVYGKIYVAAKPALGFEITDSEKLDVINNVIKPVSVVTVIPEFVDVDYGYLKIYAKVYYDPTKTTRSSDSVKLLVRNSIINFKDAELDNFNGKYKISKLLRAIDDSEISINYSDVECVIEKRLIPQIGAARNYTLNFGTSISREDPKYRIFSTPSFKEYDNEAVLRDCFIEETPGSSSGIEAVVILSAIKKYETPPTIVINGDGVGANAYPIIVNGKLTSIVVDKAGINYTTATAALYYEDEFDQTAQFRVDVQNRFGILRSYYFDNNNIKTVLNPNAGTVDYVSGKLTLLNFDPVSISDPLKIFRVSAKPATNNFESSKDKIVTIDEDDVGSINITMNAIE